MFETKVNELFVKIPAILYLNKDADVSMANIIFLFVPIQQLVSLLIF